MTRHNVEISTDGMRREILLDGHDIAHSVTALSFSTEHHCLPVLMLCLRLVDVTTLSSKDTEVLVDDGVAETLKRLGWTPPQEQQP
ncbi:hypothetical protein [Streptomyces sp. NPDC096132]|uniref:hypothetical protein n=1 Tax=Streptomyces sp. NPDC096132 TaxID=3366075 RepID=UPI003807AE3B